MTSLPDTGIRLLEPREGGAAVPAQWGVPWPRGAVRELPALDLVGEDGAAPVDSWVTARWPDGTVKWSGHAGLAPTGEGQLLPRPGAGAGTGASVAESVRVRIEEAADGGLRVVSDRLTLEVGPGTAPIRALRVEGREVGVAGRLVASSAASADPRAPRREHEVRIDDVRVERAGEQQAVLRLAGRHEVDGESVLPVVLRLYVTAGTPRVRIVHSIVWDADPERLFLTSLGLRVQVPLRAAPHDRHVRLAGGHGGFLTEAVQGVTGLRRDPGEEVRRAQVEGRPTPPLMEWAETVSGRLRFVPCWDAWTLRQLSPDGYTVAKRTDADHPWITAPGGARSRGYAFVGDVHGGIGAGLRDFWRLHPTQLDVEGARGDAATLTVWMYSPSAEPMDLRFFHDGLGQDTFEDQLEALEITYEDYEPGFGDARGIARTHELVLDAVPATPSTEELSALGAACALPPQPAASPERIRAAGVFGIWAPVDRSTPQRAHLEDRLLFLREHYLREVEQRRWYGFWDHGDVMHTYDRDRHTWRYDVGGYAWDNSELSPDLWLWTDFLRSGDAAVFRLAEAMSRHTGEVDQYHAGPFVGLGTRHNVQHFGCSAKQLRVSSAVYRRHHFFLTADERVGELLDEVAASEDALLRVDATRKVRTDVYAPDRAALAIGLGTDLGALLGAWLTAWERHGDADAEEKIRGALAGIGALRQGFFTGEALWDLEARRFDTTRERIQVSHLAAVFGLAEIVPELLDLVDDEGFARAWDEYCRYYLATPEEQTERFGAPLTGISLIPAYSRLLAQHAASAEDPELAARAWDAFLLGKGDQVNSDSMVARADWSLTSVDGPTVLEPVLEADFLGTNGAAQYGLSAIANLALIGEHLPARIPYLDGNDVGDDDDGAAAIASAGEGRR
ncbi:exo-rhamnogalacturonan lyase family protein [Brachybacterium sp. J153]|uniref:exo-rhamnogalacturonan lyase family protein n=1 Tax=Brachybacterium sp. J153 TaxID=3116488 RepID=UPI002E77C0E4|nr:Tat pathway signal sequence domain protein [Brachybacterium sp. J153]MEE1617691.1 Tat pathway signal sequence domain protein [Brachybacterium sp. J153]